MSGMYPTGSAPTGSSGGEVLELADTMPMVSNVYGDPYKALADSMELTAATLAIDLPNLVDSINATGSATAYTTLRNAIGDALTFDDAVAVAWSMLAAESMTLVGTAVGNRFLLGAIVDLLHATGTAETRVDAVAAVSAAIAMEGLISNGWTLEAIDSVVFNEALVNAAKMVGPLVDSAAMTGTADNYMRIAVIASESLLADDSIEARAAMLADASDSVVLYTTIIIAGTEYTGWVLNTANKAASEYPGFPFESLAAQSTGPFAGRAFGAGEGGIYELTGGTDDGEPIAAHVRTGLTDMGTLMKKRVPDVWYAIDGNGRVVLKVVHTSENGEKVEDWYISDADARTGEGMREGHIEVGRGIKSRLLGFEFHNKAGGPIDISGIEMRRIILNRRK